MEWIKIDDRDNVAVALSDIEKNQPVPKGHKFALCSIGKGDRIIKYGAPIGVATEDIAEGDWVHTHNIKTLLDQESRYVYEKKGALKEILQSHSASFQGYRRKNGSCGIRNEIWIIATVGCVNSVADDIAYQMREEAAEYTDGIIVIKHPYGCSQMGEDQEATLKVLSQLAAHPNAGGVLMLGLGCENCNFSELGKVFSKEQMGDRDRIKWLKCQDVSDEVEEGKKMVRQLICYAGKFRRQKINADELIVGLKCGGSDGLSGITANPLVGKFSDRHCGRGGSVILTEVPEMFGAEQVLMNRCRDSEVFDKTVSMINDFKEYYRKNGQVIYENPSPGNKAGGITTLEDKSLGCVQKGGHAEVTDVLRYACPVKEKGLSLLEGPGNDLVAATALAVSGAHIVLFTTGRGTPFGGPVPTIKISSNHELAFKKKNWIDFDAERILDVAKYDEITEELDRYILDVASGKKSCSEEKNYRDIAIFKRGVTL